MANKQRFWVGSIECQIVSDGEGIPAPPEQIFPHVPQNVLIPLLKGQMDDQGMLRSPYNCLLIRSGDRFALVDTGLGPLAGELGVAAGHLQRSLGEIGMSPGDIHVVVISHAHPDHIGGLTRDGTHGRAPAYASARHFFWKDEWDFWTSEESLAELPEIMAGPPRLHLPVIQEARLVETIDEETEVLPGVRLLPAPGHTPGHMAVAITSGGEVAIYFADAVTHELNFEHPDWVSAMDLIPALTVQTRKRLIEQAAREGSVVVAFHLAAPGRVRKTDGSYEFRPIT